MSKSINDDNSSLRNDNNIESSLKELLDNILIYYEKFIKTKEDLKLLENKLNDYDNIFDLIEIIKDIFTELTKKVDAKLTMLTNLQSTPQGGENNYDELEKIVQKHEGEIRTHIRIEQQLKLYAESLQAKLDESEKNRSELFESTKSMINSLKRDNQKLVENTKILKEENDKLVSKLKQHDDANKQYHDKLSSIGHLEEKVRTLEKILQETKSGYKDNQGTIGYSKDNYPNQKKLNLEVDYHKPSRKIENNNNNTSVIKQFSSTISASPLKNSRKASAKNNEFLKVKIEITENNIHHNTKDSTGDLKSSFQKIYPLQKSRDTRQASSVMKTREKDARMAFSNVQQTGQNITNYNILPNGNNTLNEKSQKRSSSSQQRQRKSVSKSNFDISSILNPGETNDDKLGLRNDKKPKAL